MIHYLIVAYLVVATQLTAQSIPETPFNNIEFQETLNEKSKSLRTIQNQTAKDSILDKLNQPIGKEQLEEDFNQLVATLQQHPTQFEYVDKSSFTKLVNAQRTKLKDSMTVKEFYQIVAPVVTSLGCLHTRVVDNRFFSTPAKYWLPLIVWFDADKMYAINNRVEDEAMNVGAEILEINGVSAKEIYRTLKTTISADALNERFYRGDLNVNFLYYYHSYYGFHSTYTITFKPYQTDREITTTFFIDEPGLSYKAELNTKPRLSLVVNKEHHTGIIKIKNFNYFSRGKENIDFFKAEIDTYIKTIKENQIEKVVLDLRGNRGGNPACTNHLLSYFTAKEIDFYQNNELNFSRNRPLVVTPNTNHISNKNIFILTDGRCASATGQMLAVVKHNQLATIVGEESGGTYSTHPGRGVAPLKNTKLALQIGVEREAVNVPKLPLDKGIIPDVTIKMTLEQVINANDVLLNYVYNLK